MQRQSIRVGIFAKMLLIMLAVASLPTGLVWYAAYREEAKQITSSTEARLAGATERLAEYTDLWLESHLRMLRTIAHHPDLVSMDASKQRAHLAGIADQHPYIFLAHTIRPDTGMNEARNDGKAPIFYGDRAYVRDALGPKGYGLEVILSRTLNKPALSLCVPIVKDGRAVGVLGIVMTVDALSKQVVSTAIGKTGFAFLVDGRGKVVAHADKDFVATQKDLSEHPAYVAFRADQPQPFAFQDGGREVLASGVGTIYGLTMFAQQDKAEAYQALHDARSQAASILFGSLLAVALMAFVFSRTFTSPIRRLTNAAENLSMGTMEATIPELSRGDELGELARAVARLGVSVQLAMETTQRDVPAVGSTTSSIPAPRHSLIVPRGGEATRKSG